MGTQVEMLPLQNKLPSLAASLFCKVTQEVVMCLVPTGRHITPIEHCIVDDHGTGCAIA